jgi:glycosyltransferase involved in cell wall biosynthesis
MAARRERETVNVLVVAHEPPVPAQGGSAQRVLHEARQLAAGVDGGVTVVCLGDVPAAHAEPFALHGVPHAPSRYRALLASVRQPYLAAWSASPGLAGFIGAGSWDVVVATSPFLVAAARLAGAPVVLDVDNVEHEVAASMAAADQGLARARWRWEARKIEGHERAVATQVQAVTAPSEHDAAAYRALGAQVVDVVPNGVDLARWTWRAPAPGAVVGYVGQYGYRPNVQAAIELADKLLPAIRAHVPDARVSLIGRAPTAAMLGRAGTTVEVTGALDDLAPAVAALRVLAVPLRAGGGTRLKILEAMAAGVPVVSTALGASGLEVIDGKHLLVADSPAALVDAITRVLEDDQLAHRLSAAGRALVEDRYDWSVTTRPLVARCRALGVAAST